MMFWTIWILCGLYAVTVAYFVSDIRKYKRVTIGEAAMIGFALIGGWVTACLATVALVFIMVGWLSENGDNVLFRFESKKKPLIDGELFQVKDGQLVNMGTDITDRMDE
ncbi:hypothetical protein LCGC14_1871410 [marine sediment metagenome]|uniref:Uncharacterized protein n=1 Tax=marine sediment metagenome TaxID=412755 RepID=A0A0F9GT20_9ZZZZ